MEKLIDSLDNVSMDVRNIIEYVQEVEMLSREARSLKIDVKIYGGLAAKAMETLSVVLAGLEDAKREVKEITKEEKGEQVPSEPVQEPPDGTPGGETLIQDPGEEGSEGD